MILPKAIECHPRGLEEIRIIPIIPTNSLWGMEQSRKERSCLRKTMAQAQMDE